MTDATEKDALERRMLSGEPFTYGELTFARGRSITEATGRAQHGDHDRLIDRTIQRLRRKGLIAFDRYGGKVIWQAVTHD